MNIALPLSKRVYDFCLAIEGLPASDTATALAVEASAIGEEVTKLEEKTALAKGDRELARVLREAAGEVRRLRQANQILAAQVRVVETFRAALSGRDDGLKGMSEDIAWELERRAKAFEPAEV